MVRHLLQMGILEWFLLILVCNCILIVIELLLESLYLVLKWVWEKYLALQDLGLRLWLNRC